MLWLTPKLSKVEVIVKASSQGYQEALLLSKAEEQLKTKTGVKGVLATATVAESK